jgi:para-nitrobenzyl esterase
MASPAPTLPAALLLGALAAVACTGGRERAGAPAPAAAPESLRRIAQGEVVGGAGRYGGHAWLGIPFAKPPVGPLRWRAPEPPEPWAGTRQALAFGRACVQFASPIGGEPGADEGEPSGDEDCLTLNVYAPRFEPGAVPVGKARLPVMLWIHGGGNSIGTARTYDGSHLATVQQVVVVTTQYRLGPFGWLHHPALGEGGSEDDRSGNFGTLDLVRALQWVRENAGAFGGDPGNVTIFGESAGGANVAMLLLSPRARGLFQRAIVQSGGTTTVEIAVAENYADDPVPGHRNSSGEAVLRLLQAGGLAADRAAAKAKAAAMPATELGAWLRARPASQVLEAYAGDLFGGMIDMPDSLRDGAVLPAGEPIRRLAARGAYNAVPTILGTNRDEVKLFLFMSPEFTRHWALFPYLRDRARFERVASFQSRSWKAAGADELAAAMTAGQGPSVFVYRFDWDEEPKLLWSDLALMLGAAHGLEIPFVFGHFDMGRTSKRLWTEANAPGRAALSAQMMSYWGEFARSGNPGRGREGDLPEWAPFGAATGEGGRFLVFDTAAGGGLRLSGETVTSAALARELLADAEFGSAAERCDALGRMASRSPTYGPEAYAAEPACRAFPYVRR